jgi:hypothetical protein
MKKVIIISCILIVAVLRGDTNAEEPIVSKYKRAWEESRLFKANLLWIPKVNQVIGEDWVLSKKRSHFNKSKLMDLLKKYNRDWNDLLNDPQLKVQDGIDEISMIVGDANHFTLYPDDNQIPIIFHYPGSIVASKYQGKTTQGQIAPTVLNLLGINKDGLQPPLPLARTKKLSRPKVVVMVVIDQGGSTSLEFHKQAMPFLNELMQKSFYAPRAEIEHLEVHTLPGHSMISSGLPASKTAAYSNEYYEYVNNIRTVRYPIPELWGTTDPAPRTIAEIMKVEFKGSSSLFSMAPVKRAVYTVLGRGDKQAIGIWQDAGEWVTDPNYYRLPVGLGQWSKPYVGDRGNPENYPPQLDVFLKTLEEEWITKGKLKDNNPDFAHITLKATDYAGHSFGWESVEMEKAMRGADLSIQKIVEFLDKNVKSDYLLVVTADHGCVPLPEISGASRTPLYKLINILNELVPEGDLIEYFSNSQLRFNPEVLKKNHLTENSIKKLLLELTDEKGNPVLEDVIIRED